jgi:hypothetical protein
VVRAFEFMTYRSSVAELRAFFEEAGAYDPSPMDDQVAARRDAMYARVEEVRQRTGKRAEIGFRKPTCMSRLVPSSPHEPPGGRVRLLPRVDGRLTPPTAEVGAVLEEIDGDPTSVFWG